MNERRIAWMSAALVATIVTTSVGLASHLMLRQGLELSRPSLEEATQTGAAAVGQAIAGQFAHALELGIPLDRLPGIDSYLQRIVEHSPQVEGLALLDGAGRVIHATAGQVEGETYPVEAAGSSAAIVVQTRSSLFDQAVMKMRFTLAIAALLAGAISGFLISGFVHFHRRPALHRFRRAMESIASGDYSARLQGEERGPLAEAGHALSACIAKVSAARRMLASAVVTIKAIDFDGSLGRRVDAITKPLDERYRFAEESLSSAPENGSAGGVIWRIVLFLGVYGAAFPFVANFAMDRESEIVSTAWVPVLPFLAEIAAACVGAWAGSRRADPGASPRWLGGLLLAGSLAATYWCRSYDHFVLLRAVAGFSLGLVGAGLLSGPDRGIRPREIAFLVVFGALLAAPLLSGLYADAMGRRSAFLILGIAMLLAVPFIAAAIGTGNGAPPPAASWGIGPADLSVAIVAAAAGPAILVLLPTGIGFDSYLIGGSAVAFLAAGILLAPARAAHLATSALLLCTAALFLESLFPVPTIFAACALLGLSGGAVLTGHFDAARHPWMATGAGTAAGLLLAGLLRQFDLPSAVIPAVCGVAFALMAVTKPPRRPAGA